MLAGARRQRPLVRQRLQLPDAGRRGLATATFAKPALLSRIYAPTSKVDRSQGTETLRSVDYLIKAGFIRQSSAGIYSLLPFGQRVLEKLEKIIEHEMYSLDASKVSLPNLLPPALWKRSGRWDSTGNELWRLQDRRKTEMLLAPTHEEEITALVSDDVLSEKALPVRLFQIGRKFRDEARPRAGLLRGREFLMKDLYTFDATLQDAEHSYDDAKAAYCRIFDAIGLPYRVAVADTGNIGGTASHEFHYVSPAGEDTLITCRTCATSANSEMARSAVPLPSSLLDADHCTTTLVDLPDTRSLGIAITRNQDSLNLVKIRKRYPNARTVLLGRPLDDWNTLSVLLDEACASVDEETAMELVEKALGGQSPRSIWPQPPSYEVTDLRTARDKDACVQCNRPLLAETSIEIGHTFLLGTKYSEALDASFARSGAGTGPQPQPRAFFQMGCYGIGVSRLLGSIAEVCADAKGLVWPVAVAPYEVCILATSQAIAREVLATLFSPDPSVRAQEQDVIIDDRYEMSFGKRMKDGELSGYPFLVIAGRHWQQEQKLEVQVRSTGDSTLCTAENLLALLADCRASASGARLRSSGSLWNRPR